MKIKVNKHKLNIHYRGSPWGSRTQQHAYCLRYAHSQHVESHLGKKQPQAKIAIAFLFGQLHFNNVTSHSLFYVGHLVMRSKRCAMQNQGITLKGSKKRNRLCVDILGWMIKCDVDFRNSNNSYRGWLWIKYILTSTLITKLTCSCVTSWGRVLFMLIPFLRSLLLLHRTARHLNCRFLPFKVTRPIYMRVGYVFESRFSGGII